MTKMVVCIDETTFRSFQRGELRGPQLDEVERHLAQCAACSDRLLAVQTMGTGPTAPGCAAPAESRRTLQRGAPIGRHIVLDLLGAGGMGEVYAAYDPELGRKVAIKVLRLNENEETEAHRARLLREAQALARLSHPNVVTLYDAGIFSGQFLLIMELVVGTTLRQWQREAPRTAGQVLTVYVAAARGLEAAHAVGLVHRDFKPENVLVAPDGTVKVTDFGIVHALEDSAPTEARPGDAALDARTNDALSAPMTLDGALLGTPGYMAPEQYLSELTDPRTDQFAFACALYEALYGERPFAGSSFHEIAEAVVLGQVRPAPPSSSVPAYLRSVLLRALSTTREERYPSMDALVTALLDDPAVRRRARWRTAATAALTLGLLGAALGGWLRSGALRDPCADQARQLAGAWDEGIKARVRAAFQGTGRVKAADTAARVFAQLDRYAGDWAAMRTEVCQAYLGDEQPRDVLTLRDVCLDRRRGQLQALTILLAERADPEVLDKAVTAAAALHPIAFCADTEALTARVRPPEDPALRARVDAVQPRVDRLEALLAAGKFKEGLALGEPLLGEVGAIGHPPLRAQVQYWVGRLRAETGDYDGAKALLRDTILTAAEGRDDVLAAHTWARMLNIVSEFQKRFEEADALRPWGLAAVTRAHDESARAWWLFADGTLLFRRGKLAEAKVTLQQALAIREKVLGPGHPDLAYSLNVLGSLLNMMGEYPQSKALHERALAIREKVLGPDHPSVAISLSNLATVLRATGNYAQAVALDKRAMAIQESVLGPDHPDVAVLLDNLANLHSDMGDYPRAKALAERALALDEKGLGPDHPDLAYSLAYLGRALIGLHELDAALAPLQRALVLREKALGPSHAELAEPLLFLAELQLASRKLADAVPLLERALVLPDRLYRPEVQLTLADTLWSLRRDRPRASALAREARAEYERRGHRPGLARVDRWLAEHPSDTTASAVASTAPESLPALAPE